MSETGPYELVLRPSRSTSAAGRSALYGGLAVAGALATYFTLKAGIWPVAIMLDTAFAAAAGGMVASQRSGKAYERIRLTDTDLEIRRFRPGQRGETLQRLSPFMLRVETVCDDDGRCEKLLLASRGGTTEIGRFLPPDEKNEVAAELRNALRNNALPIHLRNEI